MTLSKVYKSQSCIPNITNGLFTKMNIKKGSILFQVNGQIKHIFEKPIDRTKCIIAIIIWHHFSRSNCISIRAEKFIVSS